MYVRIVKGIIVFVLLAFCFSIPRAWAVERCVLVELLTWVYCNPCTNAAQALDSLIQEYPGSTLATIRYFPFSNDPYLQPESVSRAVYYQLSKFPTIFFDGGRKIEGADTTVSALYSAYKDSIEVCLAMPSPLSMNLSVTYDTLSHSGQVITQVTAVDSVEADTLYLRYALIESGLVHDDKRYDEVLRDMYPDDRGVSFTLNRGETLQDTVDFALDPLWLPENCDLVVFVQDDATKEVLQSIQMWIPLPQVPATVEDVETALAGGILKLTWSPVTKDKWGHPLAVGYYRVFKNTSISVIPDSMALHDSTQGLSYLDSSCVYVGDTQLNCYYCVTAVAGGLESDPSHMVGEFDKLVSYVK